MERLLGIGKVEIDKEENAFKITEGNNSKGVTLLSHKKYKKDLNISFDVKPLQFKGVCVVIFSATSLNGKAIKIPGDYDGNSDFWISANSDVRSYAIAFHTAFHQPNILMKKNPGWKSLGEIKDVVTEEKWYKIDIIKKRSLFTLKINGKIVLESKDVSEDLLGNGQVGLRLKGPGDGSFSVLYKNLVISK